MSERKDESGSVVLSAEAASMLLREHAELYVLRNNYHDQAVDLRGRIKAAESILSALEKRLQATGGDERGDEVVYCTLCNHGQHLGDCLLSRMREVLMFGVKTSERNPQNPQSQILDPGTGGAP